MEEAIEQRCHRIGCRMGIDHENDGQTKHTGYLVGRAPPTVVAVEESHHALDDAHVGIGTIVPEQMADMLFRGHERIEVDARPSADTLVKLRVDVVGSTLEGLHPVALAAEECHQSAGNGCLARARCRCCYQKAVLHCRKNYSSRNCCTNWMKRALCGPSINSWLTVQEIGIMRRSPLTMALPMFISG